jgi:hypothetical protein
MQAAQNIVPISATAGESVQKLRDWASGRCLSADVPGIFTRPGTRGKKTRRSIPRDPSQN